MSSVPRLSDALQRGLLSVPEELAVGSGYCQRRSKFTASTFVQTTVLGWAANPAASLHELCVGAGLRDVVITPQGLDQRFTAESAVLLEGVLQSVIGEAIGSDPAAVPVLRRFPAVLVLDSTIVTLPDGLATTWPGFGGRVPQRTQAAVKATVQLDLVSGQLTGPDLSAARVQDRATPLQHAPIPVGALRISDRGYWSLPVYTELVAQGGYFLSYLPVQIGVCAAETAARLDIAEWLQTIPENQAERAVTLGYTARLPVRLVAVRLPPAAAAKRRRTLKAQAKREHRTLNKQTRARAGWEVLVTNAPPDLLTPVEALVLLKARWQIELLFKLWKDQGQLDTWRSANLHRIHCELVAKLIALVIQHWLLVMGGWSSGQLSLTRAAKTIRAQIFGLLPVLDHRTRLTATLRTIISTIATTSRITKRKKKPGTWQLLANPDLLGLA